MIKGNKVILRPFKSEDAKDVYELKMDFEGYKAFAGSPFPSNIEDEKEWIGNMYGKGVKTAVYFAIENLENSEFSGYCVARNINYLNRNAEVGIILSKSSRGKGLFKEVSYLFYNYLFAQLNMHKVYSFVIEENIGLKTDKQIGYVEEGLVKEHLWQDGIYKNLYFLSLYKDNFNRIWDKGLDSIIK